jgi:hypothetical protein
VTYRSDALIATVLIAAATLISVYDLVLLLVVSRR